MEVLFNFLFQFRQVFYNQWFIGSSKSGFYNELF